MMERTQPPNADWKQALEKARVSIETGCEIVAVQRSVLARSGFSMVIGHVTLITEDESFFYMNEYDQVYKSSLVDCHYAEECSDCDYSSHGAAIEGICDPCAVKRGWLVLPEEG